MNTTGGIETVLAEHQAAADWHCQCGEDCFGGSAAYGNLLYRSHIAGVIREFLLSDAVVERAWEAMDAAHDSAYHVHAAECCWSFPNVARAALAAAVGGDEQ